MTPAFHSIKTVARRTGLSAYVIRSWEKRYRVVEPTRTGTNRRLYSEDQIRRLSLLREATQAGHSIGNVARLPLSELETLSGRRAERSLTPPAEPARATSDAAVIQECLAAVKELDFRGLESALNRAATRLGSQGVLQRVLGPLAEAIGDCWRGGALTAAHEHFATVVIRMFLGQATKPFAASEASPVLVAATLVGQLHELGALLAAATATNLGWHVTYLGPSLPAAEIAGAARQRRARAVALSFVYPEDDPRIAQELARLRELLPPGVDVLAGGRACPAYRTALDPIGAQPVRDLAELCVALDNLRAAPPPILR
jgi:MerR family transcriptional regulator, light-induced transcriptional regulator